MGLVSFSSGLNELDCMTRKELYEEIASLNESIASWQNLNTQLSDRIDELNHLRKNDEAANQMLSDGCARIREHTILECASLFSGGMRNREIYVNDVEEMILGLSELKI